MTDCSELSDYDYVAYIVWCELWDIGISYLLMFMWPILGLVCVNWDMSKNWLISMRGLGHAHSYFGDLSFGVLLAYIE